MVSDNNRLRDALGVTAWHKAGYTGKGITAASGESWDNDSSTHGWKTAHTFLEVAPNANLISLPWAGVVNDTFGLKVTDGIKTHGVSVFWASIASAFTLSAAAEARFAEVADRCVLMISGGNKNSQDEGARVIESPSIWGVNACMCMADGRINPAYYNFNSNYIDFCAPDGWMLPTGGRFTGTSAATPALAGMAALVQQMAFEQIGRALSADEMYAFFASCARPVGSAAQCGLGLPVLPAPGTVDLSKFTKKEEIKEDGSSTGSNHPIDNGDAFIMPDNAKLTITEYNWQWGYNLTARSSTDGLVLHHAAGDGAPQAIHVMHLGNGWAGIGYHYYVRKDGSVHRGRPEWAVGAGVAGENSHLLHICFEGNYETEQNMPAAQYVAGRLLVADVLSRWQVPVYKHSNWGATACPGRYFPFDKIIEQKTDTSSKEPELPSKEPDPQDTALGESAWSIAEGGFARATALGVMDGTRPRDPVTREQLAAILLRLGLLK